jgi:uncharacterized protein YmfQ (DUF2313 family)
MSRTPSQVQAELLALAPPGWIFPADVDSYFAARLLGLGAVISDLQVSSDAMGPQVDPRFAFNLLPDYQRVLGPDPCGRDTSALGFEQQAAIVYQRWTAGGPICAGYFENMAAGLGVDLTIVEVPNWVCGASTCSDQMVPYAENFAIAVNLPATSVTNFECGAATCDDSLGTFIPNLAVCPMTCSAPLHITFFFNYDTAATGSSIALEDGTGSILLEDNAGYILQES